MILTSHSELGNTGEKTGFWVEEFAAPYYVFMDGGEKLYINFEEPHIKTGLNHNPRLAFHSNKQASKYPTHGMKHLWSAFF